MHNLPVYIPYFESDLHELITIHSWDAWLLLLLYNLNYRHNTTCTVYTIFTARCYASAVLETGLSLCLSVCVCLCLSQVRVLLKRLNVGSHKQHHMIAQGI